MNAPNKNARKPGRPRRALAYGKQSNQITVHLPPALVNALDAEMSVSGVRSRSELIREACHHYLQQRKNEGQTLSATQRMRNLPPEERRKVLAQAAASLAEYYRTDPEIQEWQALDAEDFYDIGN